VALHLTGRCKHRDEDNIKIKLKETGREYTDWIHLQPQLFDSEVFICMYLKRHKQESASRYLLYLTAHL
jgi:hypothetical protein